MASNSPSTTTAARAATSLSALNSAVRLPGVERLRQLGHQPRLARLGSAAQHRQLLAGQQAVHQELQRRLLGAVKLVGRLEQALDRAVAPQRQLV
jgi:hypothetical protein